MKTRLACLTANLGKLEDLIGDVILPEGFPSYVVRLHIDPSPLIVIDVTAAPNEGGRDQLLALAGDLFGRSDWVKKISYGNSYFHWEKDLQSVGIKLEGAERIPLPPSDVPVPPTAFPLLLTGGVDL